MRIKIHEKEYEFELDEIALNQLKYCWTCTSDVWTNCNLNKNLLPQDMVRDIYLDALHDYCYYHRREGLLDQFYDLTIDALPDGTELNIYISVDCSYIRECVLVKMWGTVYTVDAESRRAIDSVDVCEDAPYDYIELSEEEDWQLYELFMDSVFGRPVRK